MSRAPGTCCYQCKTCSYLGQMYNNGDQWGSSQDACRTLSCKVGLIRPISALVFLRLIRA